LQELQNELKEGEQIDPKNAEDFSYIAKPHFIE
jgi:hypothetical protein